MKRVHLSGFAGLLLSAVAIALAGSAIAYFPGSGTGSAAAAVSKLTAPTFTTATPAVGGKVTLTWGALTPPGSGTVTYYVTRDGGEPAGNCPDEEAPTTVKTCIDETVPVGEHSYQVTAVWHSWEAASIVKTAKVMIGGVGSFAVAASEPSIVAGGTANLTIAAVDENGNTVTTYTGNHNLVFSGAEPAPAGTKPTVSNRTGSATNFGATTSITFTNGVSTVNTTKNGVARLYRAGIAAIVATEGSITTPDPPEIVVSSLDASKFVLSAAATSLEAGTADDLTITAQDTYGNTATTYSGPHSLVFSTASAGPAGNVPTVSDSSGADVAFGLATTIEFSDGIAKASEGDGGKMLLYKSASTGIKAAEGTTVTTPTQLTVTVSPGAAAKLVLTSATATPVAATGFNLTMTAQDVYGNTATGYTGTKGITFDGATASPSGAEPTVVGSDSAIVAFGEPTTLTFANGVAAPASSKNGYTKLYRAEAVSLTASDGEISTASPLALTVSTGAANRIAFTGLTTSAGTVASPCFFTCTITSLGNSGTVQARPAITDSSGNPISNLAAKSIKVTATSGGTVVGSPLTTAASGPAVSTTEFTYTAPAKGNFTHTITASSSGYTSATATVGK